MLALATDAFGGHGGIAQYNRNLFCALSSIARIRCLPRRVEEAFSLPDSVSQYPPVSSRLVYAARAMAAGPANVVFCAHLNMVELAAAVARHRGAKLIVQTHGVDAWTTPAPRRRAVLERADLVLAVSRFTRARVLDWAAIAPERVAVLSNTVSERFSPGTGEAWRAQRGLLGKTVLLTVGRLSDLERAKGHDRVIRLLPRLRSDGRDVVYVIIGDGDDVPRLRQLALATGVADAVRFFGAVPTNELPEAYRAADIFVMPSTCEGFGIVFLEAMACGTPALGLAIGGAVDALMDGTAVAEKDLGDALSRLISAPRANGAALAARTRSRFGQEVFARHARSLFEKVIESGECSENS